MTTQFSTERFQLALNMWAQEAASPKAGGGATAAIGSFWQEAGTTPTTPTSLWMKTSSGDTGWCRENLVGLNVFNVTDYGAVGDGVTDDTLAIQDTIDAADAAGGGIVYFPPVDVASGEFYLVSIQGVFAPNDSVSILMDDVHNILLMGDGYASMISAVGDAAGDDWRVFLMRNGCSNIQFNNLSVVGTGMANTLVGGASYLIAVIGNSADANAGDQNITVTGCYLGPANNGLYWCNSDDDAHRSNRLSLERCSLDGSSTGTITAAVRVSGYVNLVDISENYLLQGGTSALMRAIATAGTAVAAWEASRNHFSQPVALASTATRSVGWGRGLLAHNTWTGLSSGVQGEAPNDNRLAYRGNIVVITAPSVSVLLGIAAALDGARCEAVGNVMASLDNTGTATFSLNISGSSGAGVGLLSDNAVQQGNPVDQSVIGGVNTGALSISIEGNIVVVPNSGANNGAAVRMLTIDQSPCVNLSGNLALAVGSAADNLATGIRAQLVAGAARARLTALNYNLIAGARVGVNFSTGTFIEWRAAQGNNMAVTASATATVAQPTGSIGVTHEGPAGPGSQIALSGATMIGNVAAPQGSLGCNTVGGQAVTLFRKEAGTGVSGGTGDWYGIGGFDVTFGALLGSLNTTNRFFAPGGFDLAVETATEILVGMPRPCTVRNLRLRCTAGTGGGTNTYTTRKNGVDTTLTVAILNTAATGTDTTHSFTMVSGDTLSQRVSKSSGAGTPQSLILITLEIV